MRGTGSELPAGHPDRKFKGRFVFQGNQVKDEHSDAAVFQALSSSPAALEASKALDAYGALPGNSETQAAAEQAYVQAELTGTETWVMLPEVAWPASWKEKTPSSTSGAATTMESDDDEDEIVVEKQVTPRQA